MAKKDTAELHVIDTKDEEQKDDLPETKDDGEKKPKKEKKDNVFKRAGRKIRNDFRAARENPVAARVGAAIGAGVVGIGAFILNVVLDHRTGGADEITASEPYEIEDGGEEYIEANEEEAYEEEKDEEVA